MTRLKISAPMTMKGNSKHFELHKLEFTYLHAGQFSQTRTYFLVIGQFKWMMNTLVRLALMPSQRVTLDSGIATCNPFHLLM